MPLVVGFGCYVADVSGCTWVISLVHAAMPEVSKYQESDPDCLVAAAGLGHAVA